MAEVCGLGSGRDRGGSDPVEGEIGVDTWQLTRLILALIPLEAIRSGMYARAMRYHAWPRRVSDGSRFSPRRLSLGRRGAGLAQAQAYFNIICLSSSACARTATPRLCGIGMACRFRTTHQATANGLIPQPISFVAFWPQRQSLGRASGILSYCWGRGYSRISYGRNMHGLQTAGVLCSLRLSAI